MQLRENDVLGDRFRLERLIGEGGMGMVWAAADLKTKGRVALKFLRGTASASAMKRFFREARAAMAVSHPNVVRVHEVCTGPDGAPLMVMDYLEGESLGERLEKVGKLPLADTAAVLTQVVSAIGMAHEKGIVHRDLKPDNVFLCNAGARFDVRVLDFGIAKLTASEGEAMATAGLTSTGAVLGTPYYMSPEQVFADKTIDHRADVWSIGVMLYECLSGKKPLSGDSVGALLRAITDGKIVPLSAYEPALPEEIVSLASRMISTERDNRPRDLREVQAVLRKYAPQVGTLPFGEATADGALAFDDTLPGKPLHLSSTNDGIAKTHEGAPAARSRSSLFFPSIALVAVVAIGGGVTLRYMSRGKQAELGAIQPASTLPSATATSTSTSTSTPTSTPTSTSTSTSTSNTTPSATSNTSPSATPTSKVRPRPSALPALQSASAAPVTSAPLPKTDVVQTNPYATKPN